MLLRPRLGTLERSRVSQVRASCSRSMQTLCRLRSDHDHSLVLLTTSHHLTHNSYIQACTHDTTSTPPPPLAHNRTRSNHVSSSKVLRVTTQPAPRPTGTPGRQLQHTCVRQTAAARQAQLPALLLAPPTTAGARRRVAAVQGVPFAAAAQLAGAAPLCCLRAAVQAMGVPSRAAAGRPARRRPGARLLRPAAASPCLAPASAAAVVPQTAPRPACPAALTPLPPRC
jgi:hypothetical protein